MWEVLVSMFWFMLLFAWIWLIISIFGDMPWVGALVYLIVRGRSMGERSAQAMQERDARLRSHVHEAAGTPGTADELRKLGQMRDDGVISASDDEQAKAKVLA